MGGAVLTKVSFFTLFKIHHQNQFYMKKILFSLIILMSALHLSGQSAPPTYGYHYQAIIRDNNEAPVSSGTPVQLRFQILNSANQVQYEEIHETQSDQFGKVEIVVGAGISTYGLFDTLNWAAQKLYLGVAVKLGEAAEWADLGNEEIVQPPISKLSADGERFVGIFPISGFEEGAPLIDKNTWQHVTRTTYRTIEAMFRQPIPSGMTRHYYFFIRKADNIDNCADSIDFRFYFPWDGDKKPGHQFKVFRDWGDISQGAYVIVETLPILAQYSQFATAYWHLEARVSSACPGKQMRVMGISVFAIDKPDGQVPALNLNQDMAEGTEPAYTLGGPAGIFNVETTGYSRLSAKLNIDLQQFNGGQGRDAVHIHASPDNTAGVILVNKSNLSFWSSSDNTHANITCRTLTITGNDPCERFNTTDGKAILAGTVVVFDETQPGTIRSSTQSYDRKVAGVVSDMSEAGKYRPGIIHEQENTKDGSPVALAGTVEVLAVGPIRAGDLLTTSNIQGYAMKAKSRRRAYGAIIGKAMTPLSKGEKGKIEMFVVRH